MPRSSSVCSRRSTTWTTCSRCTRTPTSTRPCWPERCSDRWPATKEDRTADNGRGEILVLGIDPGTSVTGYGVIARGARGEVSRVECGVIRTSAAEPLPRRIREIYEGVHALIERHRPLAVSVEDVFQGKNAKSALKLGHARGAILLAAALQDVAIVEYAPRQIKKAVVGRGGASKDQVGYMVQKQLRLRDAPRPADAADGVAAALCHCLMGSFPA